jgi:hypothetical protein
MNREQFEKEAEESGMMDYFDLLGDSVGIKMILDMVNDAVAAEREACAKVCEDVSQLFDGHSGHIGVCIANAGAIRARGQA